MAKVRLYLNGQRVHKDAVESEAGVFKKLRVERPGQRDPRARSSRVPPAGCRAAGGCPCLVDVLLHTPDMDSRDDVHSLDSVDWMYLRAYIWYFRVL